jgi:hypothetical protein
MVDVPIPRTRRTALFPDLSQQRMFDPVLSEFRKNYDGPELMYANERDYPPASIRFYNPGAIGNRSDKAHLSFGALASSDLPGSNGDPLATPAFETPEDGVAYYGYYIQARVGDKPTIDDIITAYATGHPKGYTDYIVDRTGLDPTTELNEDELASVARAMFEWESGGTNPDSMNALALNHMLDNVDIKAQIKRGRDAAKGKGFGKAGKEKMADVASVDEQALETAPRSQGAGAAAQPQYEDRVLVDIPHEEVTGPGNFANLALGETVDLSEPTAPEDYVLDLTDSFEHTVALMPRLSGFDEVRRLLMQPPVKIEYVN